jgi:nucleotide-binding universal stress UspA family protein
MRVIAGTDFSENAAEAARAAGILARRWGASLSLAHVDAESRSDLPQDVRQTLAAWIADRLRNAAVAVAGCKVEEHMLSGSPATALADFAAREEARLLVVGASRGRDVPWLMGSTSERVAEISAVPVLVVREAEAFARWTKERPLRVFIAFDFGDASRAALAWAQSLLEAGPCEIVVGYVDRPLAEERRLGVEWPGFQGGNPPEIQKLLERALREAAESVLDGPVRVRCEPSEGRTGARLLEIASEEHADLFLAGVHRFHGLRRIWHPSISRALLRNREMNLLCVPASTSLSATSGGSRIRNVLAAVNLADDGGRAVARAYEIAPPGAVVRLFHVVRPPYEPNPLIGGSTQSLARERERPMTTEEARERLERLVPRGVAARGIDTEIQVLEAGDVARAICQEAERFDAGVICLGAPKILPPGGVAQGVINHTRRPVLLARSPKP